MKMIQSVTYVITWDPSSSLPPPAHSPHMGTFCTIKLEQLLVKSNRFLIRKEINGIVYFLTKITMYVSTTLHGPFQIQKNVLKNSQYENIVNT